MFKHQTESSKNPAMDYLIRLAYIAELEEWDNRLHIERIRKYCEIIGKGINLPQEEVELISLGSQLHDIGKITIPEELLKSTGDYQGQEWEIIERHTIEGAIILNGSSSPILQKGEIIAYTHHERWDGSGYPQGLKADDIPISGRICAIADVFDALTTRRTYKDAINDADGLKLIQSSSAKLFDPRIVDVFSRHFDAILKVKKSLDAL